MQPGLNQPLNEEATAEALVPPRLWWLKRLAIGGALLIVVLVVVHSAALFVTERKVDALTTAARAAGQPVHPDDFNRGDHLPVEHDAAALYRRAAGLIAVPSSFPAEVTLDSFRDLAFIRSNLDLATDLVNTNGEVLALFRKSRQYREADWGIRFTSPMLGTLLPMLSSQRTLSRFTCAAAVVQHYQGNDAQCVEILRDMLHHGAVVDSPHPILVTHMIATACRDLAVRGVEAVAPRVQIRGDNSPDVTSGAASREQVEALIAELLAVGAMHEALRDAILFERAMILDAVNCICDGSLSLNAMIAMTAGAAPLPGGGRALGHMMKPLWRMDAVESFEYLTSIADAHEPDNFVAVMKRMPADPAPISHDMGLVRPSVWLTPSLMRQTQLHFRNLAMRRMAAIALALRLYELDHGRRPVSLGELVPDYLAAVPLDPFDGEGGPIRYLPDGDPPLLYSVGIDGVDSGGEFTMRRRSVDQDSLDLVFFLDGNRPVVSRARTQPATAPAGSVESLQEDQPADTGTQPARENPPDSS